MDGDMYVIVDVTDGTEVALKDRGFADIALRYKLSLGHECFMRVDVAQKFRFVIVSETGTIISYFDDINKALRHLERRNAKTHLEPAHLHQIIC